jgi:hypothetical protein
MPQSPAQDRPLASDDPILRPGWQLLEFLCSIAADEFTVRVLYAGDGAKQACDKFAQKLAFASLGERTRECTVTYAKERNPRQVAVWRLDSAALNALREIMPDGVLGSSAHKDAWVEDLCVYRRGELIFGTVSHERYAFLRLSDAEWRKWEAQPAARPAK